MEPRALIYELIPKVMDDVGSVGKNRKNEQQKYSFRGIEDMYLAVHPAMVKHGVFCAPDVIERQEYRYERTNEYGKTSTWLHVAIQVAHKFYASDGSCVVVTTWGEGLDNSDKATNKAMSGAMKYALIELFCVPTADIEDSDRTTPEAGMKPVTLVPKTNGSPAIKPEPPDPQAETVINRMSDPPVLSDEGFIIPPQRSYLSRRFRESLKPELEPRANELRHAALEALHRTGIFKSKLVDEHGNPTHDLILVKEYQAIGQALVKAAKEL